MYRLLTKYGTGFAFGLGLLVTLIFLIPAISGVSEFNMLPPEEKGTTTIFNAGLYCALALIIIGFASSILFGIYQLAAHPKGAVKFLISIAVIAVLFFILYSMSAPETGERMQALAKEFNITDGISKLISAALKTVLALAGIAVLAFVFAEIRNLFK